MPLLKGKANIGHNIKVEEATGKPHKQAVAIAMNKSREHDVAPVKDEALQGEEYKAVTKLAHELGTSYGETVSAWLATSGNLKQRYEKARETLMKEVKSVAADANAQPGAYRGIKTDIIETKRTIANMRKQIEAHPGDKRSLAGGLRQLENTLKWLEEQAAKPAVEGYYHGKDEVQPVGDVEGFMEGGVFHPIDGSKGYSPKKAGGKGHGHQYYKNRKVKKGRAKDADDAMQLAQQAIKQGKTLGECLRELPKTLSKEELQSYSTAYVMARGQARDAAPHLKPNVKVDFDGGSMTLQDSGKILVRPDNKNFPSKEFSSDREALSYLKNCTDVKSIGDAAACTACRKGDHIDCTGKGCSCCGAWMEDAEVNYKLAPVPPKPRQLQSVALRPEEVESVYKPHTQKELGKSFGKDATDICLKCGKEIPYGDDYCRECSAKAKDVDPSRPTSMNEKPEHFRPGTPVYHTTGKQGSVHSYNGGKLMVAPDIKGSVPEEWDVRRTFTRANDTWCPTCNGAGERTKGNTCVTCNGSGHVDIKPASTKAKDGFLYGGTGKLGPAFESECIQTQRDLQMLEETMNNEVVQEGLVNRAMIWLAKAQNPKNADAARSTALVAARKDLASAKNKQISRDEVKAPGKWSNGWQPAEQPSGKPQHTPIPTVVARIKSKAKDVMPV
jgi:hypothetical protein